MVLEERLAVRLTVSDNKGIDQLFRGEHPDLRPAHIWWDKVLEKLGKKKVPKFFPVIPCEECGTMFTQNRVNKVTCSEFCSAVRRQKRQKEWTETRKQLTEERKQQKNEILH